MLDFFHTFLDRVEAIERGLVCGDPYPMAGSLGWEIEIILASMINFYLQMNFLEKKLPPILFHKNRTSKL